jgi:peptidoglycan/LPS O-acetylase OafA/YrhL
MAQGSGRIPFRGDIEGLRGAATLIVLAYHAGVPLLSGGYVGLDIFFVMSGFLITALLVREAETTGGIRLRDFFARRIRRLLPSAVAVLAFVVVAGWLIMAPLQREPLARDVLAANFYVVNWRFVDQQTDYLAAGLSASPVQHFWSLSVEEQFYVVWPVVLLGAALIALRTRHDVRALAGCAVVAIGVVLFAYALGHTREAAGAAYFSTFSRGWEFAIGAALALVPASRVRIGRRTAAALTIAAVVVLAWCAVTFDEATLFPGPAALAPCLATAAIILAGVHHTDGLTARGLAIRPLRWVGRISYSWYLWHWPLLVFAALIWGDLPVAARVGVVAASLVPTLLGPRLPPGARVHRGRRGRRRPVAGHRPDHATRVGQGSGRREGPEGRRPARAAERARDPPRTAFGDPRPRRGRRGRLPGAAPRQPIRPLRVRRPRLVHHRGALR